MKTYIVQPGHVLTASGGQLVYAGGEIQLDDDAAKEHAHAVALKPEAQENQAEPSADS